MTEPPLCQIVYKIRVTSFKGDGSSYKKCGRWTWGDTQATTRKQEDNSDHYDKRQSQHVLLNYQVFKTNLLSGQS